MSLDDVRILHLSDTHFFGDDTRHYGVVDTRAQLERVLEAAAVDFAVDLVVCSGDVSEDGTPESYRRVAALLASWADARGARVILAMGNHDRRAAFRSVLGGGQLGVDVREPEGDDPERPVVSVAQVDGLRTIVLDSSVPARGYGAIARDQLAFLGDELASATGAASATTCSSARLPRSRRPTMSALASLLQASRPSSTSATNASGRARPARGFTPTCCATRCRSSPTCCTARASTPSTSCTRSCSPRTGSSSPGHSRCSPSTSTAEC